MKFGMTCIKMTNPIDHLAQEIAESCLRDICCDGAHSAIAHSVCAELKSTLPEVIREAILEEQRKLFFEALYKALEPHEKRFQEMVRGIWAEEERIIVANLKKLKKSHMRKDAVDQVMYPAKEMEKKLAEEARLLLIAILTEFGQEALDDLGISIAFDVTNPYVAEWIKSYPYYFAQELEKNSVEKLRKLLTEAMEQGKTIPEMIYDLRQKFTDWDKFRAERVARYEANHASNAGNEMAYKMGGIKRKEWHANPGCCEFCKALDGTIISIDKNFYDLGDTIEMEVEGKKQVMNITYQDVRHPPLHGNGRCTLLPVVE